MNIAVGHIMPTPDTTAISYDTVISFAYLQR
jgi:hypothetical protein